jgi:hypothetical protein
MLTVELSNTHGSVFLCLKFRSLDIVSDFEIRASHFSFICGRSCLAPSDSRKDVFYENGYTNQLGQPASFLGKDRSLNICQDAPFFLNSSRLYRSERKVLLL